jgi:DNA-binding PadR family transcriptional regulator
MIWDSVQNQLGNYSIKIKDIVITLSDLEDKNLIKNTYYEINEQGRNKIRANPD